MTGWQTSRRRLAPFLLRPFGLAVVALVAGLGLPGEAPEARTTAVVGPTQSWVTDGDVLALASAGGSVYAGGDFTLVGRATGSWAEIDGSGAVRPIRGLVRGEVDEAVSDGRGGWFLVGDIASVGGVEVKGTQVVHLRATGRLDRTWKVDTNGAIYTAVRTGRRLYVGGDFTKLNGLARRALAAVDLRSGEVLDWQPRITAAKGSYGAEIHAIAPTRDGRTVFVAGSFGRVNGAGRRSLAAIGADGKLLPFDPGAAYTDDGEDEEGEGEEEEEEETATVDVLALEPRGRVLYVGGDFTELGGGPRPGLGAVDVRTGRARPWNPDCDGYVQAIEVAPAGSPIYVAGEFASVGGKSRRGLAAVDARRGTATLWDPSIGGSVSAIALDAKRRIVYAGGEFEAVGEQDRTNLAAVDTRTGTATGWDVPVVGTVEFVAHSAAGGVAVGGEIESVGALRRNGLAAFAPDGSAVTGWQAPLRGIVRALSAAHGRMYVGGRFSVGETRAQRSLATIDLATGALAPWGPNMNSGVWAIAPGADGETVFVGGAFTTVEGKARRRIAALGAADGALLPWASGASAVVRAVYPSGDELWVAGQFTSIGGEPRRGVAAVEVPTGRATGWEATSSGNVETVVRFGDVVYVGGPFTAIGGRSRKHLAALDAADGSATRWDPAPDDIVRTIGVAPAGDALVVGGDFTRLGGGRRDLGALDLATGLVTDWRPIAPFNVLALAFGETQTLFAGGTGAIAVFRWPPPPL